MLLIELHTSDEDVVIPRCLTFKIKKIGKKTAEVNIVKFT